MTQQFNPIAEISKYFKPNEEKPEVKAKDNVDLCLSLSAIREIADKLISSNRVSDAVVLLRDFIEVSAMSGADRDTWRDYAVARARRLLDL